MHFWIRIPVAWKKKWLLFVPNRKFSCISQIFSMKKFFVECNEQMHFTLISANFSESTQIFNQNDMIHANFGVQVAILCFCSHRASNCWWPLWSKPLWSVLQSSEKCWRPLWLLLLTWNDRFSAKLSPRMHSQFRLSHGQGMQKPEMYWPLPRFMWQKCSLWCEKSHPYMCLRCGLYWGPIFQLL